MADIVNICLASIIIFHIVIIDALSVTDANQYKVLQRISQPNQKGNKLQTWFADIIQRIHPKLQHISLHISNVSFSFLENSMRM